MGVKIVISIINSPNGSRCTTWFIINEISTIPTLFSSLTSCTYRLFSKRAVSDYESLRRHDCVAPNKSLACAVNQTKRQTLKWTSWSDQESFFFQIAASTFSNWTMEHSLIPCFIERTLKFKILIVCLLFHKC